MNLLDAYVTLVLSLPYQKYGKWWVVVEADCYGRQTTSSLMFDSLEEAMKVKVGWHFLT